MKKCLCIVACAIFMLSLCANTNHLYAYSASAYDSSCEVTNNFSASQSTCASSCSAVSASSDCGHAIYEIDAFPGSSANSTSSGNGSGLGCQYFGHGAPLVLGAGSGSSRTFCTSYTASSSTASYVTYMNAYNPNCINRSIAVYNANTCSTSGISVSQPTITFPGGATGLVPGSDYVVCHTYTENGCADAFQSSIVEVCMNITEASYCSSNPDPRNLTAACSGDNFQLILDNNCTADPDLSVSGVSGFAAFYYYSGGQYTNFPSGLRASDISTDPNIRFFDESNAANGGGCSPININAVTNTSCMPLDIPVGIIGIDVSSVGTGLLYILPDCEFTEATLRINPQLTSQVSGSNVQLISANGTVCETYSTTGGNGNTVTLTPTFASGIVSIGGIQLTVNGTYGNIGTLPSPPPGKTEVTTNTGSTAPCVTPGTTGNRNSADNTGLTSISHTVEVTDDGNLKITLDEPMLNQVTVYPNPANNQLFFNTGQNEDYMVRVYDTFGKQVFYGTTTDDNPLEISHLPSGLYTYALENEAQTLNKHGKWVKK